MKIIVTGGAGFIGSHLCERLLTNGHEVICIDNFLTGSKNNIEGIAINPAFSSLNCDLTKPLPQLPSVDMIFHMASPASPNHHSPVSYHALPVETMMVNTVSTHELLKVAQKMNAKFLFASTSEIYGDPKEHPQKEDYNGNVSTTGPRSVYDEAKRFGETITAHFGRAGMDTRIARIFNTYGPRMQKNDMRMVVTFINQALSDQDITVFGDGTQTRSLCFVTDTVDGLIKLMFSEDAQGAIVNIGSPEEHTVLEYAEAIKKLTGSKSKIAFSEDLPEDDPKKRRPDISKAKKLLDWDPKVSLEEGLKKMIEYCKQS